MVEVNGKTRVMGLIGNPVEHTLSPVIHNTLNELLGINGTYVPFHVEADAVDEAVRGAFALNILGLNVTVPHKNRVMESLVSVDPVASAIGAVNTLVREEQAGFIGYNTDMPGLLRALNSEKIEIENQEVIILGAGGASKAVAYMCMQEQAKSILMLNRTEEKAREIVEHMNQAFGKTIMRAGKLEDYSKLEGSNYLVFQCTSIGLSPNVNQAVIEDESFYKKVKTGVDLIYNPAETRFMKLVKAGGGQAINGLKMLLYQGIIAYELWNHVNVTEEMAEETYDRLYGAIHPSSDNIILIGYMGCGKTTVGQVLAKKHGYTFLDTDEYIEKRENMTIPEIFEKKGEAYFREVETKVLSELIENCHHCLISTGGGMPLRRENARLLRELGTVFYLDVSEEKTWERVRYSTNRPLLKCDNPRQKIHDMITQRKPLYEKACHHSLTVEGQKPDEVAEQILAILG